MERMKANAVSFKQYLYISLIIVLSSFEYFFRAKNLLLAVFCAIILDFFFATLRNKNNSLKLGLSFGLLTAVCFVSLIQTTLTNGNSLNNLIGTGVVYLGSISVAFFLNTKFVKAFSNVILFIAVYSGVIYLATLIPSVYDTLYALSARFVSLNVENAVFDGGGANIVIYNFQTDVVLDAVGFNRNCGPFWEPGMFAFFLSLALFFELFLLENRRKGFRILILSLVLISTFSTGGYVAGIAILVMYSFLNMKSLWIWVLIIPVTVLGIQELSKLEFIGEKIENQYNNRTVGSDKSRFGALETQLFMIEKSPLVGGEKLENYATGKTLASGTLLPFVGYGIPVGIFFFFCLYLACFRLALQSQVKTKVGIALFILILIMSFSQTILVSAPILLLIFSGLQLNKKTYLQLQ